MCDCWNYIGLNTTYANKNNESPTIIIIFYQPFTTEIFYYERDLKEIDWLIFDKQRWMYPFDRSTFCIYFSRHWTKPSANSTDPTDVMTSNIRWLRQRSLFTHLPFPTTSGSTLVTLFWHSGSPTQQSSATLYVRLWDFSPTLFVPKSINISNISNNTSPLHHRLVPCQTASQRP